MERVRAELDGVDSFEPILSLANFDPKIYDVEPVIRLAVQTYDQHGFVSFQQFMQTFKSNVHGRNRLSIGDLQNQALISLIPISMFSDSSSTSYATTVLLQHKR